MDHDNDVPAPTLESVAEQLRALKELQNAHYTEIMLKLEEMNDVVEARFVDEVDDLYEKAVVIVRQAKKASTSYLQRKLGIGYAMAARLIDELEGRRVIGPADGSRPRDVLPFDEPTFSAAAFEALTEEDERYPDALATVESAGYASTELLQAKLGVGYARAAKLIDMLEDSGVIAPGQEGVSEKRLS